MQIASYTVNQFSLVDEKNTALKDLLTEFEWQEEALLRLSLPLMPMIDAIGSLDDAKSLDNLRDKLVLELKELKRRGRDENVAPALLDKLCFLWAAYFDERVSYECALDTTQWQNNTLVSQLFGIRNSGETFFSLLKQLMEFPKKHLELIKICYLLLQLGFKGQFNNQQHAQLNKIIADVNFAISELAGFKAPKTNQQERTKALRSHLSFGLFKGVSIVPFSLFIVVLLAIGLVSYNYYVGTIYQKQHLEYDDMAKSTLNHIEQLQPKKVFIENTQYLEQHRYQEKRVVEEKPIEIDKRETIAQEQETAITRYFVQIGAFYELSRAVKLQTQCSNESYALVIEADSERQRVGYIANGYTQAKLASDFLSDICQVSPYIKEYQ